MFLLASAFVIFIIFAAIITAMCFCCQKDKNGNASNAHKKVGIESNVELSQDNEDQEGDLGRVRQNRTQIMTAEGQKQ